MGQMTPAPESTIAPVSVRPMPPAPVSAKGASVSANGTAPATDGLFSSFRPDIAAGVVVFLVALPLCLGIAQASGAPLLSGLIAGFIGGLVVAGISQSPLSVSGPAAGLAVIVASGISTLGFRAFLVAVLLAGAMQLALGVARLGVIAHYFPIAVIKGMLAAIGVLIIMKQLPHAVGYDAVSEGDLLFRQADGSTVFSSLAQAFSAFTPAAVAVALAGFATHFGWVALQKRVKAVRMVPAALVLVVVGALVALAWPGAKLEAEHLVALPRFSDFSSVMAAVVTPDFSRLGDAKVWTVAATLAIVASIETLLSLEAIDRLDPMRRISPPNRELIAQGAGNMLSGLIGGLPITSVIVRSSANVMAGGRTRLSAMTHGVLLLLAVLFLAPLFNQVPLAALAVVLLLVGAKLTPPSLWRAMWRAGLSQFIPFAVTVFAVVFTDLLKGTFIGLAVGLVFAVRAQQKNAIAITRSPGAMLIRFTKDMTFLQKAQLKEALRAAEPGTVVTIDRSACDFIDDDIEELLLEFSQLAPGRRITVKEKLPQAAIARRLLLSPGH